MSRIGHFRRGVSTAYLLLGANVLYSLASVPLGLNYLSQAEFGLWAIVIQLSGYLQQCEQNIVLLRTEMREHRKAADLLKAELPKKLSSVLMK